MRLNPEVEPAKYRVICQKSFKQCERQAREVCGREYQVLNKDSNVPELPEVQSTGVSSTGPSEGLIGWRGEMTVQCGKAQKPLRLVRPPASAEQPTSPPATGTREPARVCVPGVTQVCLGPGACSGAQACNAEGTGFLPCDCGAGDRPAPAVPAPPAPDPPAAPPADESERLPSTVPPASVTPPSLSPPEPEPQGAVPLP